MAHNSDIEFYSQLFTKDAVVVGGRPQRLYKGYILDKGCQMVRVFLVVSATMVLLSGCAGEDWGRFFTNAAAGTAESACRSSSSCSVGMRRDPLAPKPAWQTGGAAPKDWPSRLPPPK